MAIGPDFSIVARRAIHPGGAGVHLERPTALREVLMPVLANIIGPELLIVLAIALVLFGSSKLPQLARSLGSAKGEFERGLHGDDETPS